MKQQLGSVAKYLFFFLFLIIFSGVLVVLTVLLTPTIVDAYTQQGISLDKLPALVKLVQGADALILVLISIVILVMSALIAWILNLINRYVAIFMLILISLLIAASTIGLVVYQYWSALN